MKTLLEYENKLLEYENMLLEYENMHNHTIELVSKSSLFCNPRATSNCLLSLLVRYLCRLAIRREEVVVKETIPIT